MATAPTEFTLNADVYRLVADTADVGADLDMPAIAGLELYFYPEVDMRVLLVADVTPRPVFIKPEKVTGYIRSNGRMYDQPAIHTSPAELASGADITDPGNLGVRLLASGAELNLVDPLQYTVSSSQVILNGAPWSVTPWSIPAPTTDIVKDLASLAPVAISNGQLILRGPAGPGADAVRLNGSNQIVFSFEGVDLPNPLSIASASVPDGSVTTVKIVDANVTLAKLAGTVQTSLAKADTALQSLAANSVGSTQINANAVTTVKILDANVTLAKLAAAVQTSLSKADTALQALAANSVGSTQINANAVTTAKIADLNVTLVKLAATVQTSLGKADTAAQPAGDLSGTATAPIVSKVNGVTVVGVPSVGQVMRATGVTTAAWQDDLVDADLNTFAGLTPVNDDVLQRKAGAWTNRTVTQLVADILPASVNDDVLQRKAGVWTNRTLVQLITDIVLKAEFIEAVQDIVSTMIVQGTGITKSYNDAAGTLTLSSTGGGGGLTLTDDGTGLFTFAAGGSSTISDVDADGLYEIT